MVEITFLVGGPQGKGVETASIMLIYAVGSAGYYVYGRREFWSNIAGGRHSYFVGKIKDQWPPGGIGKRVQLALLMDGHSVFEHIFHVEPGGIAVYNTEEDSKTLDSFTMMSRTTAERLSAFFKGQGVEPTVKNAVEYMKSQGVKIVGLPFNKILLDIGRKIGVTSPVMLSRFVNTLVVAVGASLLGLPVEYVEKGVGFALGRKKEVIEQNKAVAAEVSKLVAERIAVLAPRTVEGRRIYWNGNEAVSVGKIMGGARFVSFYPITPSTDDPMFAERKLPYPVLPATEELKAAERIGAVVLQTEDELAAIAAAAGAAMAGARAATATSGPGMSLMAETISMLGMAELGVVITLWSRAGPSTGLATRTGQHDLFYSLFIGHGEFPKIVLASGDIEEAFYDAIKVVNWADKYQVPVIHLVDKDLSNTFAVMPAPDPYSVKIERPQPVVFPEERNANRYEITDDGMPVRYLPGVSKAVYHIVSLEHDPEGDPDEDAEMVKKMYEKRMKKMSAILKGIPDEDKLRYYGPTDADVVIVSWGTTKQQILSALERLPGVGFLQLRLLYPFPADSVRKYLQGKRTLFIEGNYTAQSSLLVRMYTGISADGVAVKYNGRPITTDEVIEAYERFKKGETRIELEWDL
ncbi:MAG: 2-oxoacid:acceptor oxidoreductase subunit alpha [Thermoproteus sp.]